MKDNEIYVLCSYGEGLNEPFVTKDFQEAHEKMKKEYKELLNGAKQKAREKEENYLGEYEATAVVCEDRHEWTITSHEL